VVQLNLQNIFWHLSVQTSRVLDNCNFIYTWPVRKWPGWMATPKQSNSCSSVKVVNDLAERGVALIQEFNSLLTRSEVQKELTYCMLLSNTEMTSLHQQSHVSSIDWSRQIEQCNNWLPALILNKDKMQDGLNFAYCLHYSNKTINTFYMIYANTALHVSFLKYMTSNLLLIRWH